MPGQRSGTEKRAVPDFSVAIIARNEAHTLPKLFQTLEDFQRRSGEVVLVDTGSSDGTAHVAREASCRVEEAGPKFDATLAEAQAEEINVRFAKNGEGPLVRVGQRLFHFAKAREHVTALAGNDFVLHLDASDELLALDLDFLNGHIRTGRVSRFAYWREATSANANFGAVTYHSSWFYNRWLYHWEGRAHEALYPNDPSGASSPRTVHCTGQQLLIRHTKDDNKPRHYLGSLALNLIAEPGNPRWTHYLGRELYYCGWYRSAMALLEEHASAQDAWTAERSESLCLAGACYEALRRPAEAAACYSRACKLDATRREPLLRLAELCRKQGDFRGSVTYAAAALTIPRTNGYLELEANYTYLPHAILYWSLFWLGQKKEARQHWEACLRLAPENPHFRQHAKLFSS
jgi:tetratricopeptide (TPR) repeat protein